MKEGDKQFPLRCHEAITEVISERNGNEALEIAEILEFISPFRGKIMSMKRKGKFVGGHSEVDTSDGKIFDVPALEKILQSLKTEDRQMTLF